MGWWMFKEVYFWLFKPFPKQETKICKYLKLIKIQIFMTCVCIEYKEKFQIVQEQWLQLKTKKTNFFVYNKKNFYLVGAQSIETHG